MPKLSPEKLLQVAVNSNEYGYRSYALFEVDRFSEEELKQYLLTAVLYLFSENSQLALALLGNQASKESNFFLSAAGSMEFAPLYPKANGPENEESEAVFSRSLTLSEQTGFPAAILSLLQKGDTKEIIALLSVLDGVDPRPALRGLSRLATRKYRDSVSRKN